MPKPSYVRVRGYYRNMLKTDETEWKYEQAKKKDSLENLLLLILKAKIIHLCIIFRGCFITQKMSEWKAVDGDQFKGHAQSHTAL